ncbi:type II/IV secretion system protein [Candidatus Woesebacteria bacterium]|nr:type II/IV secretion system protein [Candidatus Woesebacteria bacterium]
MTVPTKQFLDVLVTNKIISADQAQKCEVDALQKNIPIDEYLVQNSGVAEIEIVKAKATVLNIPWVTGESMPVAPQALALVPESLARKYLLIPFELNEKEGTLKVAMVDPFDVQTIGFLQKKTAMRIIPTLALKEDLIKTIDIVYTQSLSPNITEALKEFSPTDVNTVKADQIGDFIKEAPIAKIVKTILEYAVKGRASDIHIEPQEERTRIRYRIDGMLQEKLSLPKTINDSLISRIKIISGLKIDEKRAPQDGRFNFRMGEDEVDLRVSTLPTVHGEKVVMRLLKKTGGIPTVGDLGLRGPQLKVLEEAMLKPYGIVLVTGPTGSGKSTSLYSMINRINKPSVNIVTLEDPVEYQLAGVNQVQINPQAGLTFATGLRAFLRQDPNVILVGEIRDSETTQLALQAALTGHLVFSTLHTNDAATAIPRLIDLGGEPFLISSVLNAVVAQRIARRISEDHKVPYTPDPVIIENIKEVLGDLLPQQYKDDPQSIKLYNKPNATNPNEGYFGRVGIFEVIKISRDVEKLIVRNSTANEIQDQAIKEGLITMKQDGYLKALDGITTLEEVLRVAQS